MLSLFIAATILASGGDARDVTLTAVGPVWPSRILPSTVIPCARSASRNAPTQKSAGSSTTSSYNLVFEREPTHPRASTTPSGRARIATRAPALPGTMRTLLAIWIALDDGSSATVGVRPATPGVTATQTRLSLSDRADTRAAYPEDRYRESQPVGMRWDSNALGSPTTSPATWRTPAADTCCARA